MKRKEREGGREEGRKGGREPEKGGREPGKGGREGRKEEGRKEYEFQKSHKITQLHTVG